MPSVGELCNRDVVIIRASDTLLEAARRMHEHHVGTLVLVEEQAKGRVATGIITDRDIVAAMALDPSNIKSTTVGKVVREKLHTATPDEDSFEVLVRMRGHGVRRFPVVDGDGVLVGIIAFDDLLEFVAEQVTRLSALVEREQQKEREASVAPAGEGDATVNHGHLRWR